MEIAEILDIDVKELIISNKEKKLVASIRLRPGLKLFSYNVENGEIKEVEFSQTVFSVEKNNVSRKVKYEENKLYVQALNLKNAKKKFKKTLIG